MIASLLLVVLLVVAGAVAGVVLWLRSVRRTGPPVPVLVGAAPARPSDRPPAVRAPADGPPAGTVAPAAAVSGPALLRALFAHLLLLVAVIVSAVGAAGFLGRALAAVGAEQTLAAGPVEAARNSAFLVVGLPVAGWLGTRVLRSLRRDPAVAAAGPWAAYVTLASLVSLAVTMVSVHDSLVWAFGLGGENPRAVGRAVVWSLVWLVHRRLDRRFTPPGQRVLHVLVGSGIGLATTAVGLVGVLGNAFDLALGTRVDEFTEPRDQLLRSVATLTVGGAAWTVHWWADAARRQPRGLLAQGTASGTPPAPADLVGDALHGVYLLVAGVVAGTVTAVVGTAWALTDVLTRLLGSTGTQTALEHFRLTPHLVVVAVVGLALRGYHVRLLGPGPDVAHGRTGLHRLRDHGTALVGLVTSAVGGTLLVVALVEAVTRSAAVAGTTPTNRALTALAVLGVGLPTWWLGWRAAEHAVRTDGDAERRSPVRRVYLLALLATGTLVGFGALVACVYGWFEDLFAGDVSTATLRSVRAALGLLVVAGTVAGTHLRVVRAERSLHPRAVEPPGLRSVLLVGPADADLVRAVATATGATVTAWPRTDGAEPGWPVPDVVRAVTATGGRDVVVVAGPAGLVAVPVSPAGPAVRAPRTPPAPPASQERPEPQEPSAPSAPAVPV